MISKIVKAILAYIAIAGTVTLSLFMLEEAFQTAMFGTWPSQDAQQWQVVKQGADLMEGIGSTLKIVNSCAGWIQPLAFISYRAYAKSADYYVTSLRAKVFAHAPELFVGETVSTGLIPASSKPEHDNAFGWWRSQAGRLVVLTDEQIPLGRLFQLEAELQALADGTLFFDLRD